MIRPSRTALALPALLALSVVAAACGGGGGGSKPTISSFGASPASMPFGGGQVTFHWTVKGASTLDLQPGVGAVTGTSATVAITTSGQWTLTATNSHGSVSAQTSVVVGAAMTVQGTVATEGPIPGLSVLVLAQPASSVAQTDTAGHFQITNVVAPYDLAVVSPLNNTATVYRGLTRPDPTILIDPNPGPFHSANLSGTLAAGAGFPEPANTMSRLSLHNKGGFKFHSQNPSISTGAWTDASYGWSGPTSVDVVFHALEWVYDASSHPVTYTRFGTATKSGVTPGATITGIDVPLAPVASTGTLTGTLSAPSDFSPTKLAQLAVAFAPGFAGGPSIDPGDALTVDSVIGTSGTFSFKTPVLPNTTFVLVTAGNGPTGASQASRKGLASNASAVNMVLPPPSELLLPPDGAFGATGTLFAWTAPDQSVSRLQIIGPGFTLFIVQEASQLSLPDLTELGIAILPGDSYGWTEQSFGSFSSIDDAAGPGGLRAPAAQDQFNTFTGTRVFVGAPN